MNRSLETIAPLPRSPKQEKPTPTLPERSDEPETRAGLAEKDDEGSLDEWFNSEPEERLPENPELRGAVEKLLGEVEATTQQAEKTATTKIGKAVGVFGDVLKATGGTLGALYEHVKEESEDFLHDASDAAFGTASTDTLKSWWGNIFGKQNAHRRTHPGEQHRGVRELSDMARTSAKELPAAFLRQAAEIPADFARRFAEWSPQALREREQLAQEMERSARETRDRILREIQRERDALHLHGLSSENQEKLRDLNDREDNVNADYQHEVARGEKIQGGAFTNEARLLGWTGISASLDVMNYIGGMDHLLKEMGQSLVKDIQGERRNLFAERTRNAPYSKDAVSLAALQEKPMGIMERFGDWLMTKATVLAGEKETFTDTIVVEVRTAKQKEASLFQDIISRRIQTLTEKTALTASDKEEIGKLATKLREAQQGLIGTQELSSLIDRASALEKRGHSQDDERLLMGYLSGRAINAIKTLEVIPPEIRNALIKELQEHPSREALQATETFLYTSLDENVNITGMDNMSAEQRKELEEAQAVLEENLTKATEVYTGSLTTISAEIVKQLQAVNRELKKVAARAEKTQEEQAAAK